MAGEAVVPMVDIDTEYSNISRNDFPDYFVFGTGTAAYQHEGGANKGGRGQSVWDVFTLKTPGRILDGSNGNVAADMYHKYEEDIKIMKSMGFDTYRFSISWPRLLPSGKVSLGVNNEGIDFYNKVINCLIANGIEPYVTLFHWDLPQALQQEYGGFLDRRVVHDFREFAELCFWNFGDRVKNWMTLNEPWTYAVHGYVDGDFPPGEAVGSSATGDSADSKPGKNYVAYKCLVDRTSIKRSTQATSDTDGFDSKPKHDTAKDVYTVTRNLLLSHAAAVDSYRTKFKDQQKGKIGITLNCLWFEPYNDTTKDVEAVKRAIDFMLGWYLEPVLIGQYPKTMVDYVPCDHLEPFTSQESELLKGSIDFLGLNYYTANYAEDDPHATCFGGDGYYQDQQVAFYTEKDEKPIGKPTGAPWLFIVPSGIYKLLKYINTTYNLPSIYITENGMGDENNHKMTAQEACIDKLRVMYYRAHLGNILKAINEENVDVRGYFLWSWCDNFEWFAGYTQRYGIIYVDYMNYLNRHPKASALWFTKFLVKTKRNINCA